jgi:CTP synthase (UTP-ammonia lyase)
VSDHADRRGTWIAVVGDRQPGFEAQDTIADAVKHSTAALDVDAPECRWIATDALAADGVDLLAGAAGVWCAPGSPFRSMDGALAAIRWAREWDVPFIGTCAGFQHAVIEFARHVLGHGRAGHAEYEGAAAAPDELVIDELLCSLVGQTLRVEVTDPVLVDVYGATTVDERYYCRFGLHPAWREPLDTAGLRVAGVDVTDGDVRIMRIAAHPFFVITLFVPQTASTPDHPHPLISRFVSTLS